jgi:hypothetical protein
MLDNILQAILEHKLFGAYGYTFVNDLVAMGPNFSEYDGSSWSYNHNFETSIAQVDIIGEGRSPPSESRLAVAEILALSVGPLSFASWRS